MKARSTRVWHHYWSDRPTFPRAIYVLKSANANDIMPSVYVITKNAEKRFSKNVVLFTWHLKKTSVEIVPVETVTVGVLQKS